MLHTGVSGEQATSNYLANYMTPPPPPYYYYCYYCYYITTTTIIVIIIIIILGISFMQGIYTYIPETNHVPREHCCNYSDVTIHGVYIASSCVDYIVSLR